MEICKLNAPKSLVARFKVHNDRNGSTQTFQTRKALEERLEKLDRELAQDLYRDPCSSAEIATFEESGVTPQVPTRRKGVSQAEIGKKPSRKKRA